jgi:hypothetical protein
MRILNTRDMAETRQKIKEMEAFCRSNNMLFGEFLVLIEQFLDVDPTDRRWARILRTTDLPRDQVQSLLP